MFHLHPDYVAACHDERRQRLTRHKIVRDADGRPVNIRDLGAEL